MGSVHAARRRRRRSHGSCRGERSAVARAHAARQVTSKRRRIGASSSPPPSNSKLPIGKARFGPGEPWDWLPTGACSLVWEHAAARHWRLRAALWRQGVAPSSRFPVGSVRLWRLLPLAVHCFIRVELPIGPRKKNARKSCRFAKGRVANPHHHALQPRHDFSSGEVVYPTALLIDSQHVLRWHRRLRCAARFFAIVGGG
jgi:hypothetical protein